MKHNFEHEKKHSAKEQDEVLQGMYEDLALTRQTMYVVQSFGVNSSPLEKTTRDELFMTAKMIASRYDVADKTDLIFEKSAVEAFRTYLFGKNEMVFYELVNGREKEKKQDVIKSWGRATAVLLVSEITIDDKIKQIAKEGIDHEIKISKLEDMHLEKENRGHHPKIVLDIWKLANKCDIIEEYRDFFEKWEINESHQIEPYHKH